MLDGLWLRAALTKGALTLEQARRLAHDYLDLCLAMRGNNAE